MKKFKTLLLFRLKYKLGIPQLKYMIKNYNNGYKYLVGVLLIALILVASLLLPYFLMLNFVFEATRLMGNTDLYISFLTSAGQILLFFTSIFYSFNSLYASKDSEFLLTLPFPKGYIFLSSYIMSYIMSLVTGLLLLGPGLTVYYLKIGNGMVFIKGLLLSVLYPIIPLSISLIIVLPIMYGVNRFKHKEAIATVAGFVLLGLFVVGNMTFSSGMQEGGEAQFIAKFFTEKLNLPELSRSIVPYSSFMDNFLIYNTKSAFMSFIALLLLNVIVFGVTYLICKRLYESLQQRLGHASKGDKAVDVSSIKASSPSMAFCKKEIKLVLRSPVYALNCLVNVIIGPIAVLSVFVVSKNSEEAQVLSSFIEMFKDKPYILAYIFYAFVVVITSMNFAPSTTFSREGTNFWITKIIPVPFKEQVKGRILASVIFYLCCAVTMVILIQYFLQLKILYFLAVVVLIFATILEMTYLSIAVDFIKPKLYWSSEAEAVKRNINAMVAMLLSFILCSINVLPLLLAFVINGAIAILLSIVISVSLAIVLRYALMRLVNERYHLINV